MRVVTLFEPNTQKYLAEHFVLVTHNQLPGLYCSSSTIDATAANPYPPEQLAVAHEGAGGGNVRSYFCTPDGRVVNYVAGFWEPERFLNEADWALARLAQDAASTARDHRQRIDDYQQQRNAVATPEEVEQMAAALTQSTRESTLADIHKKLLIVKAFNRLARSHREVQPLLHQSVAEVLRRVEDDIYIKGTLGCD